MLDRETVRHIEERKAEERKPLSERIPWLGPALKALLFGAIVVGLFLWLAHTVRAETVPNPVTGPSTVLSTAKLTFKRARYCAAADIRVIDGDTLVCRGKHIRILGLDAPELHIKCEHDRALAAKQALTFLVKGPQRVLIREARQPDKYGRTLGVVLVDGKDVAPILIGQGLAHAYEGGKRGGWC